MNGLGSVFHWSVQAMMSFASPVTDLWTPRRRSFWVRSPNQRSALCRYQHKIDYADTVIMPNS